MTSSMSNNGLHRVLHLHDHDVICGVVFCLVCERNEFAANQDALKVDAYT